MTGAGYNRRVPLRRASAKLGLLLGCAFASALACRSLLPPIRIPGSSAAISEAELHTEVFELVNRFSIGVAAAADEIAARAADRTLRRRALLWKVRMIPLAQELAFSPGREGYVELLMVCSAQRQYLSGGAGSELFAEHQEIARVAAERIESDVRSRAERFFGRERAAALAAEVEQLAQERPIQGEFVSVGLQRAFAEVAPGGSFDWLFELPMAPFQAFEGVESGAQAIHEFNATARQLGDLAARLPELSRWQLELFVYDLEERETVDRSLAAFEQLAASAERFSAAAGQLPNAMREELSALLEQSAAAQSELQRTLESLRQAAAGVDATLANARPFAESLERVAGSASVAGANWAELVAQLRAPPSSPSAGRPFDVTEYERTATGIRDAAAELRALIEAARAGERSLSSALLWRGLALLAAFFALLLLYRVLAARLGFPRSTGAD